MCVLHHCAELDGPAGPAELGSAALFAYLIGRPLQASTLIEAAYCKFGPGGLYAMAVGWCALFLDWIPDRKRDAPVHLMWKDVDTGFIRNADQIPPTARWAGRMIATQAAGDEGGSLALFDSLPDEKKARVDHLEGLLQALVLQLQARGAEGVA